MLLTRRPTILGEDVSATKNRTRSLIERIFAITLHAVGRQIRRIPIHAAILVALLSLVVSEFSQTTLKVERSLGKVALPSPYPLAGKAWFRTDKHSHLQAASRHLRRRSGQLQ